MKKVIIIIMICVAAVGLVTFVAANTVYRENISPEEVASIQAEKLDEIYEINDIDLEGYDNMKNAYHVVDILPDDPENVVNEKKEYNELAERLHEEIDKIIESQRSNC